MNAGFHRRADDNLNSRNDKMIMQSTLKSVPAAAFATLLAAAPTLWLTPTAAAQEATAPDDARAKRIEGAWESQVNIVNPQTGATVATFRGLTLFIAGGSLTATNNTPHAPALAGPSIGRWEYLGKKSYAASFRFFRFNPDGSFAGSQRVTRAITMAAGAQGFTGTISFQTLDANDNVIQTGAGTETAVRVE